MPKPTQSTFSGWQNIRWHDSGKTPLVSLQLSRARRHAATGPACVPIFDFLGGGRNPAGCGMIPGRCSRHWDASFFLWLSCAVVFLWYLPPKNPSKSLLKQKEAKVRMSDSSAKSPTATGLGDMMPQFAMSGNCFAVMEFVVLSFCLH